MMVDTILLAFLIFGFIIFLFYSLIKWNKISRKKVLITFSILLVAIIALFFFTGFKKINSDISRIIHNSSPKPPSEIYTLLFKKPLNSCMTIINLKDQVVPQIDCCIWMEAKVCPTELMRLISLKKYEKYVYSNSDSIIFLNTFVDRPKWWSPQNLSDSLTKLTIKFDQENQQTIFFASDSSHIFICDQAFDLSPKN
jgi:hypothetical protein